MPEKEDTTTANVREDVCPACGCFVAATLFQSRQPLATVAWPTKAEAARSMPALELDFAMCVDCGHIFNVAFDYAQVPYSEKPNLMFNRGTIWSGFLQDTLRMILTRLDERPVVVEVGHGDGSFLAAMAAGRPAGRFVGFDPYGTTEESEPIEFRAELFDPAIHLKEINPDLIISRHVLEHMAKPLGFLQRVAFEAAATGQAPLLYLEVPCVDRLLETGRTVDLYYEHSSHFTTNSFTRMLNRCSATIEHIGHGYDGEIVCALARMAGAEEEVQVATAAQTYFAGVRSAHVSITAQLDELSREGRRVAIWGGTGKSAAFINHYRLDAQRFGVVVDSDAAKVGTYVPGMGQQIRSRDWLLANPVEVIIIPSQWRARDIAVEMAAAGISAEMILIEHGGRLVDFLSESHPYDR
jgi:hypothetical protein